MGKDMEAVGQPNSTYEDGEIHWREVEKRSILSSLLCKMISKRKHYLHTGVELIMETKLERISEFSRENPNMVFTSLGHMINEKLLKKCHEWMESDKAVGIDGITKQDYDKHLDENIKKLARMENLRRSLCVRHPTVK